MTLMSLGDLVEPLAAGLHPDVSHVLFGAVGGVLYVLRQMLKGYAVRPVEWLARPVFGGIAAWALTVALGLPNHLTSIFVGHFGIDIWDALATRFEAKLPLSFKHVKKEDLDAAIQARVESMKKQ